MSGIVNYDVYIFHSDTWDLLNRYSGERRAEAIEFAKRTEINERRPVKVVKETYDLSSQTFHEALVYLSERPKQVKKSPYANSAIPSFINGEGTEKRNKNLAETISLLLIIMVVSIILSGIITAVILHFGTFSNLLPNDLKQHFVIGIFTFSFLSISIPAASKWVKWDAFSLLPHQLETEKKLLKEKNNNSEISNKDLYGAQSKKEEKSFLSRIMRNFFDAFDVLMGREPLSKKKAQQEEENNAEKEEEKNETENKENLNQNTEKEASEENPESDENQDFPVENQTEESVVPSENESNDEDENNITIPPELEDAYLRITAFLSIILRGLKNKNTVLNSYARFGLELFLAGACEQMCQKEKLTKEQGQKLLSALLTLLGRTKTLADIFYYKMDEYTLEPKYLPMIKSGEEGIRIFYENPSSPEIISFALNAMGAWLTPHKKEQHASGICTIMFTDMVSSTQITQTLGDQLAQQLIHTHNLIVRNALQKNGGTEIKQTGDGIMASFTWASNAIDAAIAIQKAVSKYNLESPTVPLEVRIGLNSGEPIVEDNDLFGVTVQLASRICGQANAKQIYVSSVVKELSAGKKYSFQSLGDISLKGIEEPQLLFEVLWNDTNDEEENKNVKLSETLTEF